MGNILSTCMNHTVYCETEWYDCCYLRVNEDTHQEVIHRNIRIDGFGVWSQ